MNRIVQPPPLPARPADGHKGLFGRVLIVGGSNSMLGAPVLAGTSALRAGSGLVQIAMPADVLAAALSITPELIGLGLTGRSNRDLLDAADDADVVVVGPGLGQSADAKSRLEALIQLKDKSMLLDADALNILAAGRRWPAKFKARAVLTPHPGEMKRLNKLLGVGEVPTDERGRIDLAARASESFGQVIVLKGHRTVVTDSNFVYVNRTGDSSLSKAGAGDVLSGLIGSLIGQGMKEFDAACAGVWIHGRAGEIAGKKLGRRGVLARDVIDSLASAIAEYEARHGNV